MVTEMREDLGLSVSENRVLRKIFGRKRDGATGDWRRWHNDELPDLCSSPRCIQVIKSRRNIWLGHVAAEGRGEVHAGFLWVNLEERDHLEDLDIQWRLILKCSFNKYDRLEWMIWLVIGKRAGSFEYGNELTGSIKWEVLVN